MIHDADWSKITIHMSPGHTHTPLFPYSLKAIKCNTDAFKSQYDISRTFCDLVKNH